MPWPTCCWAPWSQADASRSPIPPTAAHLPPFDIDADHRRLRRLARLVAARPRRQPAGVPVRLRADLHDPGRLGGASVTVHDDQLVVKATARQHRRLVTARRSCRSTAVGPPTPPAHRDACSGGPAPRSPPEQSRTVEVQIPHRAAPCARAAAPGSWSRAPTSSPSAVTARTQRRRSSRSPSDRRDEVAPAPDPPKRIGSRGHQSAEDPPSDRSEGLPSFPITHIARLSRGSGGRCPLSALTPKRG